MQFAFNFIRLLFHHGYLSNEAKLHATIIALLIAGFGACIYTVEQGIATVWSKHATLKYGNSYMNWDVCIKFKMLFNQATALLASTVKAYI